MKKKVWKYHILVVCQLIVLSNILVAQSQEQIVKTAYIEKIAEFIEWGNKNANADNVFTILIVGERDFYDLIAKAYTHHTIKNMKVRVKFSDKVESTADIDLLYLSGSKIKNLEKAIKLCNQETFLLVTHANDFARKGSHINFYITNNQTLHFEMNKDNLDNDNFKVEFLLLDFAKIVKK